jgi:type I restriction enzyme S subunit
LAHQDEAFSPAFGSTSGIHRAYKLRLHSYGVADFRLRLYWDEFKSIKIPVPPVEEQNSIMAHLARSDAMLTALMDKSRRSIDLMREHRAALISAAVTGKIDVRCAA